MRYGRKAGKPESRKERVRGRCRKNSRYPGLPGSQASARGFTVIELLIVVAMFGVLIAIPSPFLSDAVQRNDLQTYTDGSADALREAQSASMTGKGSGEFGVHFETERFVYFTGASYTAGDPDNVVHDLSGNVEITSVAISGGGSDVHFADHRGIPTDTGTVTFTDVGGNTATVTIGAAGMIEAQ